MQNKLSKPHPMNMFWGETVSLEFWTIPTHSVGMSELDDQRVILNSPILIRSIDPYEPCFFWKEMCVCIQEWICSALYEKFCLAWCGKDWNMNIAISQFGHSQYIKLRFPDRLPVTSASPLSLLCIQPPTGMILPLVKNEKHVSYANVLLQGLSSLVYN